jgi:hypothetical protein
LIVRHLKPRKAAGPDGIQDAILQHMQRKVLRFIARVFKRSLELYCFLVQLKKANIIMRLKLGKDHTSLLNYRSIRPLNSTGKLLGKIVLKRLIFQLWELEATRNGQYGFKRGHSITQALLRNTERIIHGFNNNKNTAALFLIVN